MKYTRITGYNVWLIYWLADILIALYQILSNTIKNNENPLYIIDKH